MGVILKKSQTILDDNTVGILTLYRNFEGRVGTFSNFHSVLNEEVYYPADTVIDSLNPGIYEGVHPSPANTKEGCVEVSKYTLGTSSAVTPKRHELLLAERYDDSYSMYHIAMCWPGDKPESYAVPVDENGNDIRFKYKMFIGWMTVYTDTDTYDNPIDSVSTLTGVKNSLTGYNGSYYGNPFYYISSYSFGYIYLRHSNNPIAGLTALGSGSSMTSYYQCAVANNYVYNGIKYTAIRTIANGDGYTNNGICPHSNGYALVPGDPYTDTYFLYGYLASSYKLASGSYITLSNSHHTTRVSLSYIGDDGIPWLSSGQSYASNSGFLDFGSSSNKKQDYNDGLRYIYKFCKEFSSGFNNSLDSALMVDGVINNRKKATAYVSVSTAPWTYGGNKTYYLWIKFKLQMIVNGGTYGSDYQSTVYRIQSPAGSGSGTQVTISAPNIPDHYAGPSITIRIKDIQTYVNTTNTTPSNYNSWNIIKDCITNTDTGRANFYISYTPPNSNNNAGSLSISTS